MLFVIIKGTYGVLLRRLQHDPLLKAIEYIVLGININKYIIHNTIFLISILVNILLWNNHHNKLINTNYPI